MGGTISKLDEINWEIADGGLTDVSQTLDGADPVKKHSIFYISKLAKTSRRDYTIRDSNEIGLYITQKVKGTDVWFDLLEGGTGKPLLRVKAHSHHRKDWDIYTFERPSFEGQQAEEEASKRAGDGWSLYRKARLTILFSSSEGSLSLYEKGSDLAGVPSSVPILEIQEVKNTEPNFQTLLPSPADEAKSNVVGFWGWEHATPTDEKSMKMHLARGTDLALHAVVAIVSDMVWHEKQGIAASAGAGVY